MSAVRHAIPTNHAVYAGLLAWRDITSTPGQPRLCSSCNMKQNLLAQQMLCLKQAAYSKLPSITCCAELLHMISISETPHKAVIANQQYGQQAP